jgi:imidazolonepropionase-like amidohydrolase
MEKPLFFCRLLFAVTLVLEVQLAGGQVTFPENGIADPRHGFYAFTNASIVKDATTTLANATMVIRDGKIVSIGTNIKTPAGAVEVNCKGKFIYPSFIDIYANYGTSLPSKAVTSGGSPQQPQLETSVKGPYGWNQAIKSDAEAYKVFLVDNDKAKPLREAGFGTVLSHVRDGIARGTGAVVTLANEKENFVIIKERASAHYSFGKGTSTQSYPTSLMGVIALLRQTYLDAQWYKSKPASEGFNLSLKAWNEIQDLPQIFEANDKWNNLRADRIGDEFGVQYIIKAGGNEYQRIREMKATNATFILPLNYPEAQDVEDPNDARFVSLSDLKHWEMAPSNAAAFEKAGIPFCLTTSDLNDVKSFLANLRTALTYGLSESAAFNSLTKTPATVLGIYNEVGSLEPGKWANFLITSGPIFNDKTVIFQNWIKGSKYIIKDDGADHAATYSLAVNFPTGTATYTLDVKSSNAAILIGRDTMNSDFSYDGKMVKLIYAPFKTRQKKDPQIIDQKPEQQQPPPAGGKENDHEPLPASAIRLSGVSNGKQWNGTGVDSSGTTFTWTATLVKEIDHKQDSIKKKENPIMGKLIYPFEPFGWEEGQLPKQETILIKNATVWTNETEGVLQNTDVLIKNGKVASIGKNISDPSAKVIDGTGKHVTPGIIDEHSHIATASINEGGQSVTSEVRIGDNIDPDDINIYRQLGGGVTSSHILHGSANVIGGQTQLIKLRWGANAEELKFQNWPGQIKFALGENVKRTYFQSGNNRYPDTRMGVEQVLVDAFTRAKDYQKAWKEYDAHKNEKGTTTVAPRRDLELDALVEILNNKRFITCHSYVQSEITGAIEVANRMGYKYNTFTHVLEGYKVADKMKEHGANASTFSDWWAYKMEVEDAIPYNAAIMLRVGLNVAINSDDAEMARRLNQEAAKIVKYGGVTEEEALKMVTLNPAKMLHVDDKVGSLKVGKDGDVVVWSDNPLSIYAKALYTIIDGAIYFDQEKDKLKQEWVQVERNRIIKKMNGEKKQGTKVTPAKPAYEVLHTCDDDRHSHGILIVDGNEITNE